MLIENMEYLSQRLRCTDEEKDACLETVVEVLHLWEAVRRDGFLAIGFARAGQEPDPFFRACLQGVIEPFGTEEEAAQAARELFWAYLAAGDYRGADFLKNLVIAEGLLLLLDCLEASFQSWGSRLSLAVRGYFGAEYSGRVVRTIELEIRKHEKASRKTSFLPEFEALAELPLPVCERLLRDMPEPIMALSLKFASGAVQDHVLSVLSQEDRETFEDKMDFCTNVRTIDVESAQREVLAAVRA